MRDGAYIKRLGSDLERWRASGAISAEQADALFSDAQARAAVFKANPAAVAAALGAVLFGLGVITFVAANWDAMPKGARLFASLALIWIAFGATIAAMERALAFLGHAFALIGALAIGAAVALIGQTYHIEGTPAGLVLLWTLGAAATAIVFRSVPVLILTVILALVWYLLDRPGFAPIELFGGGGGGAPSWKDFGILYLPLWALGAFLGRRWDSGAAMHLSGLALLVWIVSVFADAIWWDARPEWVFAGLMICAAGVGVAGAGEFARARLDERAGAIGLAWGCATALVGLVIAQFAVRDAYQQSLGAQMAFAAVALALYVWAINWGEAPGRRAVRAIAVAGFAFECFFIYFVLFNGLLNTALFLLGGGALLLALAYALYRFTKAKPQTQQQGGAP